MPDAKEVIISCEEWKSHLFNIKQLSILLIAYCLLLIAYTVPLVLWLSQITKVSVLYYFTYSPLSSFILS